MDMVLNFPWIHSYRCLDSFNFSLFSGILMLLLGWGYILVLRACADSIYTSLHFFTSDYANFIYYGFCFRVFKGIAFFSIIISHTPHILFLRLVTPCVVFSPNVQELSTFLKNIFVLSLDFNDFRWVEYFYDFVIVFYALLDFFATYARGFSLLCFFRFRYFFRGIFLPSQIPNLLVLLGILSVKSCM